MSREKTRGAFLEKSQGDIFGAARKAAKTRRVLLKTRCVSPKRRGGKYVKYDTCSDVYYQTFSYSDSVSNEVR